MDRKAFLRTGFAALEIALIVLDENQISKSKS